MSKEDEAVSNAMMAILIMATLFVSLLCVYVMSMVPLLIFVGLLLLSTFQHFIRVLREREQAKRVKLCEKPKESSDAKA